MEQVFRDVWKRARHLVRRLHPHDRRRAISPPSSGWCRPACDNGDIYEGAYEGWYCVGCEAFKPEKDLVDGLCPIHTTKPEWIQEKNCFFRLSKYQRAAARALRGRTRRSSSRRSGATRSCGCVEGGPRGHLDEPRRAVVGHPAAVRSDQRRLRLVRRADQLRRGRRLRLGRRRCSTKWWPANLHIVGKDITRFHCVIWPAMLMSAGVRAAAAGVRPRLGVLQGRADEQVAGQRSSIRSRRRERFGPDPLRLYLAKEIPYGGDGDFTWERFEEQIQRRPGQQPRQPGEPRRGDGRALSPAGASRGWRAGPLAAVGRGDARGLSRGDGRLRAARGARRRSIGCIGAANKFIAETQPWALAKDPEASSRLGQVLFDVGRGGARSRPCCCCRSCRRRPVKYCGRVGEPAEPGWTLRLDRDAAWRASGERSPW